MNLDAYCYNARIMEMMATSKESNVFVLTVVTEANSTTVILLDEENEFLTLHDPY